MIDASPQSLTLFAMPKPFEGHNALIQTNAITSWSLLKPRPDIILFGEEKGVTELAAQLHLRHVPKVPRNEFGTPLVDQLFELGQLHAQSNVVAYVNADIILLDDFLPNVDMAAKQFPQFLMIGRRFDVDVDFAINFSDPSWQDHIRNHAHTAGKLHPASGMDYFVFRRGLWSAEAPIPPFAIGRTAWDNWLVYDPLHRDIAVIDATAQVFAIHQNHGWQHIAGGFNEAWYGIEAQRNRSLAQGTPVCTVSDSTWHILKQNILPAERIMPWFEEGMDYLRRGIPVFALARFDQILEHNSQMPNLQLGRGVALFQLGALEEAMKALKAELLMTPHSEPAQNLISRIEIILKTGQDPLSSS